MSRPLKILVGATEFPGHAFPEFALARELRTRGHEVAVQTSRRWAPALEPLGVHVLAVEEIEGVPHHGTFGGELVRAARVLAGEISDFGADVVVSDLATAAPPLAAELAGEIPSATVVATMYPVEQPGMPLYPLGFRAPRTPVGRALWAGAGRPLRPLRPRARRLRAIAAELDAVRAELGLSPHRLALDSFTSYGTLSRRLTMVATFPQLEYPRRWPKHVRVTGPLLFEPPVAQTEIPPGTTPLVIVGASSAQDPELRLVRTALDALADEPVRVLATTSGREAPGWRPPANATVAPWISYDQALPHAALVLARGGHGTVVRSLAAGVPLLVCPAAGDMPENAARVAWAGAGLAMPDRLLGPAPLRAAVREILSSPQYARRAGELAAWHARHDGSRSAADLVERLAAARR